MKNKEAYKKWLEDSGCIEYWQHLEVYASAWSSCEAHYESKIKELEDNLQTAVKYLKEGKRRYTPTTTNSLVDDFIGRLNES